MKNRIFRGATLDLAAVRPALFQIGYNIGAGSASVTPATPARSYNPCNASPV